MVSILKYTTLILLGLIVLSVFAIADVLKKNGLVKSRLYAFNPLPYIQGVKDLYKEDDINIRFWMKLLFISLVLLVPLSLLELLLGFLAKGELSY